MKNLHLDTNLFDQIVALAAVFQFAANVEQLAKSGHIPTEHLELAVSSLYSQNPDNTISVYGELGNLVHGLQYLLDTLKKKNKDSTDGIRYVMGILHLQKRLFKQSSMLDAIGSRLEKSRQQAEHFTLTHDNVIAGLADIYASTISTFSFRIQVMGEYHYLQQPRIANQIRTLLFAGIRSAVLWRQLGGSRLKIILKRKQITAIADELLKQAKQN